MTRSFDGLPAILREIAEVAGLEAAMELAEHFGGTRITIPARPAPRDWLVDCVGLKAATAICDHYRVIDADDRPQGIRLLLPRGPKGLMAQALGRLAKELQTGKLSVRGAARKAGLSERTAWRLKRRLKTPPRTDQGELF